MNALYKIAGIIVKINNWTLEENFWGKFLYHQSEVVVDLEVNINCNIDRYFGLQFLKLDADMHWLVMFGENLCLMDKNFSKCNIFLPDDKNSSILFLMQTYYPLALKKKMIFLHSSAVEYMGRGLIFIGPSGIGKTTQAELWNKYQNAMIINGDAMLIQETEDAFLGWGTPWHGSSPYCENTSVPVHAMIVLKQTPENSIRELTGFEKVSEVSNSVFYPRWLENGMELCLETLDHLLSKIPVYELSCRPDEDAVRLVEETVFK